MERFSADVAIVGAGMAGALLATRLAGQGVSVLMLDAGPRVDRAEAVDRFQKAVVKSGNSPYPDSPHAPHPDESRLGEYIVDAGKLPFRGVYTRVVGGTTWHWDGTVARFRPNDLKLRTNFGVGDDWPIDYAELAGWYDAAERELGVSGDAVAGLFADVRGGAPYPMPAAPLSVLDLFAKRATEAAGLRFAAFPQARNTQDGYQGRPACCGNNTCVPICPVQAKYDAMTHVELAEAAGARVLADCVVYDVEARADGKISRLRFKRPGGGEGEAVGRVFVIAAHVVETAKLLLMSRRDATPNGVANSSGLVGRKLMPRVDRTFTALTPEPVYPYRGPGENGCVVDGRDGEFRGQRAAFGVHWNSYGWNRAIGPIAAAEKALQEGRRGADLTAAIRNQANHEMVLSAGAEVLPDPLNRVELDDERRDALGLPRPRVTFAPGDYTLAGLAQARELQVKLLGAMGCASIKEGGVTTATGIIAGTACMGKDPRASVVDADLRAHDHDNLYILGSAVFPTATPTPPTLTIAALALRLTPVIAQRLKS